MEQDRLVCRTLRGLQLQEALMVEVILGLMEDQMTIMEEALVVAPLIFVLVKTLFMLV